MTINYSEAEASNLSKEDIYRIAEATARQLNFNTKSDLHKLVRRLGGQITYVDFWEMGRKNSGSIEVNGENNFHIYLPHDTTPERDKFTVAHELGHYFIHYLWPLSQGQPIGPIWAPRYGSNRAEWEANWFAAAFLMPAKKFEEFHKKLEGDYSAVAREFGVSYLAVETRAKALGLLPGSIEFAD